ncbi:hypothetical protein JYU34_002702 [Plutella xylostella]|uniref:Uncharacterized protein n=1 Tax=Plutella xylostella TaxID=51655 RepID=A0ABQ7R2Y4_PLUXY|nr:hypothetical protein JYU34_002702 [Plutella xylostella]
MFILQADDVIETHRLPSSDRSINIEWTDQIRLEIDERTSAGGFVVSSGESGDRAGLGSWQGILGYPRCGGGVISREVAPSSISISGATRDAAKSAVSAYRM